MYIFAIYPTVKVSRPKLDSYKLNIYIIYIILYYII